MIRFVPVCLTIVLFFSIGPEIVLAQVWKNTSGFNALRSEIGASLADGTGVTVSMAEAPTGNGAYRPDYSNPEFPSKNFVDCTGTNTMTSSHADIVGERFYGNSSSFSPGITDVILYEADDWLNTVTGLSTNSLPEPQPYGVQNHSYIGNGASNAVVTILSQRADFMASANDMLMVVGTNNSGNLPQFMVHTFNSLTVGRTDGQHAAGLTAFYHPGRVKPELVTLGGATSFATPLVGSVGAILRETGAGTNADNTEAIRAMLLAGATKTEFPGWSRINSRPLDRIFGAGELNAYNSYKILAGGETDGSLTTPTEFAGPNGWDFEPIGANQVLTYIVELDEPADHMSIVLNWDITITNAQNNATINDTLADLDLLVLGPTGVFESTSVNHTTEHIYLRDLEAAQYTIVVTGDSATSQTINYGLAWRAATESNSPVSELNILSGVNTTGSQADLGESDDNYFEIQVAPGEQSVSLGLEASTGLNWVNSLALNLESNVSTPNLLRKVEFYNYGAGQYETIDYSARNLQSNRFGVGVADGATGTGYIMYSEEIVQQRFPTSVTKNAVHLIAVRNNAGQWQYNDDSQWLNFTPVPSDHLIAEVDFSANTADLMQGNTTNVNGISAGYFMGDLEIFPEQWNGINNPGEFYVIGTFFTTFGDGAGTTDNESISYVERELTDFYNASGTILARVTWEPMGPVVSYPWTVRIDRAQFELSK